MAMFDSFKTANRIVREETATQEIRTGNKEMAERLEKVAAEETAKQRGAKP